MINERLAKIHWSPEASNIAVSELQEAAPAFLQGSTAGGRTTVGFGHREFPASNLAGPTGDRIASATPFIDVKNLNLP